MQMSRVASCVPVAAGSMRTFKPAGLVAHLPPRGRFVARATPEVGQYRAIRLLIWSQNMKNYFDNPELSKLWAQLWHRITISLRWDI